MESVGVKENAKKNDQKARYGCITYGEGLRVGLDWRTNRFFPPGGFLPFRLFVHAVAIVQKGVCREVIQNGEANALPCTTRWGRRGIQMCRADLQGRLIYGNWFRSTIKRWGEPKTRLPPLCFTQLTLKTNI